MPLFRRMTGDRSLSHSGALVLMLHSLERTTAVACGIAPKLLLVGAQPVAPSRQFVEGGLLVALVEIAQGGIRR